MVEKQKRLRKVISIITFVYAIILLIVIGSYALWQMIRKQTNHNVVGTACLSIDIENESGDINLGGSWPMTEEEALQEDPYTFTVTNNCSTPVNYAVALESIAAGLNESDNYLDYKYVRVKIDDEESQTYYGMDPLDSDTNGDYTIRATKEITEHTLAGNYSVTHSVRIWVDINTPLKEEDNTYNTNKYFYGKIKVIAGQGIDGDPEPIRILSAEGTPKATINNIHACIINVRTNNI